MGGVALAFAAVPDAETGDADDEDVGAEEDAASSSFFDS